MPSRQLDQSPVDDRAEHGRLHRQVGQRAHRALGHGEAAVEAALALAELAVGVGHHPRGRALKERAARRPAAESPARTGSPRRRCRSPRPARPRGRGRGPSARSGTSSPRSCRGRAISGYCGSVRPPMPADQHIGRALAVRSLEPPARSPRRPSGALALDAEADVGHHPELARASPQVLADLGLERIGAAPVRVRHERVRVEDRGDVALTAGIRVVAPGSADLVGALDTRRSRRSRHAAAGPPSRCRRSRRR